MKDVFAHIVIKKQLRKIITLASDKFFGLTDKLFRSFQAKIAQIKRKLP